MRTEINQYIVADTEICGGRPTFRGTRIMVSLVLELLEAGESIKEILKDYPSLTKDHIKSALNFAAQRAAQERIIMLE